MLKKTSFDFVCTCLFSLSRYQDEQMFRTVNWNILIDCRIFPVKVGRQDTIYSSKIFLTDASPAWGGRTETSIYLSCLMSLGTNVVFFSSKISGTKKGTTEPSKFLVVKPYIYIYSL